MTASAPGANEAGAPGRSAAMTSRLDSGSAPSLVQRMAALAPVSRAAVRQATARPAEASEMAHHKKKKAADPETVVTQATTQAVSQMTAQLEEMKVQLSKSMKAALPDMDRFVDKVYKELEKKMKFERQRRGI